MATCTLIFSLVSQVKKPTWYQTLQGTLFSSLTWKDENKIFLLIFFFQLFLVAYISFYFFLKKYICLLDSSYLLLASTTLTQWNRKRNAECRKKARKRQYLMDVYTWLCNSFGVCVFVYIHSAFLLLPPASWKHEKEKIIVLSCDTCMMISSLLSSSSSIAKLFCFFLLSLGLPIWFPKNCVYVFQVIFVHTHLSRVG